MSEHHHIWGLDDNKHRAICICGEKSTEVYWGCISNTKTQESQS